MLTDETKRKVRKHLGYPAVVQVATFFLGQPAATESAFMIEPAMNALSPEGEAEVIETVCILDEAEKQIWGSSDALTTKKVGEIEFRDDEFEKRIQRYIFFQGRLCNALGQAEPNPFDARFAGRSGGGINRTVEH